nr:SH3 and multiple ankyrin repeat domains protein [Hymenolepis microstoma]
MKKFINSQSSDTDSGRFSGGATSSDSSFRVQDINSNILIKISITPLSKQVYASISPKALVNHVKQKLLDDFGSQINNSINCGLFVPPANGRNGKFLEEDRPISAYITDDSISNLEFTYKKRLCLPPSLNLPCGEKSKNIFQSFLRAVARGDIKKVEKYLSKDFDPNFICPKTEESPLSVAVGRPRPMEMIKVLIAGGAHKDYRTRNGMTPLHKAAAIGNFEAVKALLDFGQSPNTLDSNGLTPLYHNILGDVDTRICHRLLYEHAQIEIYDTDGKQEIHQAALLGRTEQINLLIMYGADVNTRSLPRPQLDPPGLPALPTRSTNKSSNQWSQTSEAQTQLHRIIGCGRETPLHFAAITGQCATARRLLYWGADRTLKNDEGRTPMEEALKRGNTEVAEIIRNFRGDAGGSVREIGGSENSVCGPFLPAPTYNQKRKPMSAPLQVFPLESYVTLTDLGVERRGPSRSVTMPFPASPSRQPNGIAPPSTNRKLSPSPSTSPLPLGRLRSRACSEGDLMRSLVEEDRDSAGKRDSDATGHNRVVQSSRDKRSPRRVRRQKLSRGFTEILSTADCSSSSSHTRRHLRSWKSSNTLNEESNLYDDEDKIADLVPTMATRHPGCQIMSSTPGDSAAMALSRFRTAPAVARSPERPWSSQHTSSPASHLARGDGREDAPIPTNPFAIPNNTTAANTATSRPVSPNHRETHYFPRSPVMSPDRSGACSPNRRTICGNSEDGLTWTVVLHKAYLPDAPRVPTLGLSLRTVQNVSAVQRFVPTPAKPSLQLIKSVKPGSPAFHAGLREGDYVIKINHVDVTRACHAEVVQLLDTLKSNSVVLQMTRPSSIVPDSGRKSHYAVSRNATIGVGDGPAKSTVQRSVSMAGRMSHHNNGPAPYSPMLPMYAPPRSRCVSPGDSSVSSTDEPFSSRSGGHCSPRMSSPRLGNGREPIPRIHTAADYRIRNKFPNSRYTETTRGGGGGKGIFRQIPKSHTVNSFTEDIGVDTSSLNTYVGGTSTIDSSVRQGSQSYHSSSTMSGRAIHSVPQPPLRFLPHYSSPKRRGSESSSGHRRRNRSCRTCTDTSRPLSMNGGPREGDFRTAKRAPHLVDRSPSGYPRSFSAMSADTPPTTSQGSGSINFDPNDLVLPPPKEFCC